MLVYEIAAEEEADHVANISKHMVSRKTTISPLRTNDEKHHVPSNTQYTGAIHWYNKSQRAAVAI